MSSQSLVRLGVTAVVCGWVLMETMVFAAKPAKPEAAGTALQLEVVDANGKPVAGVKVGALLDFSEAKGSVTMRCKYAGGMIPPTMTDTAGRAEVSTARLATALGMGGLVMWAFKADPPVAALVQVDPIAPKNPYRIVLAPACKVVGEIVSTEYAKMGGALLKSVVSLMYSPHASLGEFASDRCRFEFLLPPGSYSLDCTGVGSRGAIFAQTSAKFDVAPGQRDLRLATVDLPVGPVVKLFDKPAPELQGVAAWKNTKPLTLASLRGKVVILNFWTYYCGICNQHIPAVLDTANKFQSQGLVVILVHDASVGTIREMDEHCEKYKKKVWKGRDLTLPVALDGQKQGGVYDSYGIHGTPAGVLIGRDGKVIRRFYAIDDPDFQEDLLRALGATGVTSH